MVIGIAGETLMVKVIYSFANIAMVLYEGKSTSTMVVKLVKSWGIGLVLGVD